MRPQGKARKLGMVMVFDEVLVEQVPSVRVTASHSVVAQQGRQLDLRSQRKPKVDLRLERQDGDKSAKGQEGDLFIDVDARFFSRHRCYTWSSALRGGKRTAPVPRRRRTPERSGGCVPSVSWLLLAHVLVLLSRTLKGGQRSGRLTKEVARSLFFPSFFYLRVVYTDNSPV